MKKSEKKFMVGFLFVVWGILVAGGLLSDMLNMVLDAVSSGLIANIILLYWTVLVLPAPLFLIIRGRRFAEDFLQFFGKPLIAGVFAVIIPMSLLVFSALFFAGAALFRHNEFFMPVTTLAGISLILLFIGIGIFIEAIKKQK